MPHTYTHLAENTCLLIQIRTMLQITNEYRITVNKVENQLVKKQSETERTDTTDRITLPDNALNK